MKLTYSTLRQMVLNEVKEAGAILEMPSPLDEASLKVNKYPFKAIYIFGPAGAGKSFLSGQLGIPEGKGGFATSNPDDGIENIFPAFGISMKFKPFEKGNEKGAELDAKIEQTAREQMQQAQLEKDRNTLATANPIVFDTTGEDVAKMTERIKKISEIGYDVAVFQVFVPTQVSVDRDKKRSRTVGEPTLAISQQYEKEVVKNRGYYEQLAGLDNVTMLGGDIYANLFNLETGELLGGITDDLAANVKTKGGETYTKEYAQALLDEARKDLKGFLMLKEPNNAIGQTLYAGMLALVKASGGQLGQNLLELGPAATTEKYGDNPTIRKAAELLAKMGGAELPDGSYNLPQIHGDEKGGEAALRSKKKVGKKFGMDKDGESPTIRGMTGKVGKKGGKADSIRTDKNPIGIGGDLPTKDAKGRPKKRKGGRNRPRDRYEENLVKKIEAVIWEMMKSGSS